MTIAPTISQRRSRNLSYRRSAYTASDMYHANARSMYAVVDSHRTVGAVTTSAAATHGFARGKSRAVSSDAVIATSGRQTK
jgi:hypothetical protein